MQDMVLKFLRPLHGGHRSSECQDVKMSFYISLYVCPVIFSRFLIGQKKECYIVKEVIEVDELYKGNIFAASGKQYK